MRQKHFHERLLILVAFMAVLSFTLTVALADRTDSLAGKLYVPQWHEKESEEQIAMLFTGDIMLGRYIATLRSRQSGDFPFTYMPDVIEAVKKELDVNDLELVIGNLEGPITDYTSNSGKSITFHFEPETADLLKKAGFTTLDLANNHSFDQGRKGHAMTKDYLDKAGLDGFGHPDTSNGEFSFIRYDFDKTSVGLLGLNHTDFKLDMDETLARIQELDSQVDFLIIGIHWGVEYVNPAPQFIQDMAHQFVDAGADMIWGHHPHVIQDHEFYNEAPIYYSLGNFVFDQYWSQRTQEGMVVGVVIEGDKITTKEITVDLVNQGEPKPRL